MLSEENQHWTPGQSYNIIHLENSKNMRASWDQFGWNAVSQKGAAQQKLITVVSDSWAAAAVSRVPGLCRPGERQETQRGFLCDGLFPATW